MIYDKKKLSRCCYIAIALFLISISLSFGEDGSSSLQSLSLELNKLSQNQAVLEKQLKHLKQIETQANNDIFELTQQSKSLLAEQEQAAKSIQELESLSVQAQERLAYQLAISNKLSTEVSYSGAVSFMLTSAKIQSERNSNKYLLSKLLQGEGQLLAEISQQDEGYRALKLNYERRLESLKNLEARKLAIHSHLQELVRDKQTQQDLLKNSKLKLEKQVKQFKLQLETRMGQVTEAKSHKVEEVPIIEGAREKSWLTPVVGRLVSRFSNGKKAQGYLSSRGLEYEVEPLSTVLAVEAGTVAEVINVPATGWVMILEHQAELFSLYAGLGEVNVSRGQFVQKGTALGKTAETEQTNTQGNSLGTFYFEVRNKGVAVDPANFFEKR